MMYFFFNDTATTEIYTLSYTTLFRSTRKKFNDFELAWEWRVAPGGNNGVKYFVTEERPQSPGHRSEEHTSELQSRLHLVCRLLLEKKKIQLPSEFAA